MATYSRLNTNMVSNVLDELAPVVDGLSGKRIIGQAEIVKMLNVIDLDCPKKRARVYSPAGFVPNSYKYSAPIYYIEATTEDGETYDIGIGRCDAKRSYGGGSLVVIQ